MSTKHALAFIAACLLGALAAAQPAPLHFTVLTPTETRAGCSLLALDENGGLQIERSAARSTLPRFIELRQEGVALPALLTSNFALLTNGDRIPLDPDAAANLAESRLRVWPAKSLGDAHGKPLSLYVPNVVLLFWSLPDSVDDADLFFAKLQEEPRKRDVAYLRNGDRVEGTLAELDAKQGCVMLSASKKVPTPWSKLAGIAWNTDRQARLRTKKAYYRAVLDGGARLNFPDLRFDEKSHRWVGKTQFGLGLELPATNVLALEVRQGPTVDLAELTPLRFEQRPYLGVAWPLMKNAAVTGHPLSLSDGTYEKGLGMHAPCRVAYKLDGKYQRFDSRVGFDPSIARRGRVRLAVELDGKRHDLFGGKELTSSDTPLAVNLDVRGVRELVLIVELGSFGDVQAHVNWANARLVKKE